MILVSVGYFITVIYLKWFIIALGAIGTLVMGYLLPTIKKE